MVKLLFREQREYLNHFFESLDIKKAEEILKRMLACRGSLILTGVGKSGFIANKLAMTLLSTGSRAFYLPAGDALHGDIGIVSDKDLVFLLSKSGETKELLDLVPHLQKRGAKLIALVSNPSSSLARFADFFINLPLKKELCPFNLAPTTSAAMQLIFGDILAMALMRAKNFTLDDYAKNHPGGNIGFKAALKVRDLMFFGKQLPFCSRKDILIDMLPVLSAKQCGCLLVVDEEKRLQGIFTDGDLRRIIQKEGHAFSQKTMEEVMTNYPEWITKEVLALDALRRMEENPEKLMTVLPVLEDGRVIGLIRLHDLVRAGLRG